jgi:hypothetical protein
VSESADRWTTFDPRAPQGHHRACPGDPDWVKRCAFPQRDGWDRPGHDVVGVMAGVGMMCVKEPAPVGPELGSPEPWGGSRVVRWAPRLDVDGEREEPDGNARLDSCPKGRLGLSMRLPR